MLFCCCSGLRGGLGLLTSLSWLLLFSAAAAPLVGLAACYYRYLLMPTGLGSPAGGFVSHWTRAELGNSDSCTLFITVIGHCTIPVSLRVRVNEITSITIVNNRN